MVRGRSSGAADRGGERSVGGRGEEASKQAKGDPGMWSDTVQYSTLLLGVGRVGVR